jgi:glycosyltransferase involved in cell wall biosynthesis
MARSASGARNGKICLVRILLVSQMYPGPDDPDLGAFVRQMELALRERGHDIDLAVLDRRSGGKRRYLELARRVRHAPKPDVVYAHFLIPTGLIASRVDAPLVVTAHGRDVRNIGAIRGVAALTRRVVERASAVIVVSDYLRRELEAKLPAARGKTHVIDMGVDLERFREQATTRELEHPAFLCVGSLTDRKNVVRLADAFARIGGGSLTFVGDGPLRVQLAGRERVRVVGPVPHDDVPGWLAAADVVCQPSLIEPLGQSLLEAMACARSVVATLIGGPPEFVPPDAGVLVDPTDLTALEQALRAAAVLPRPNAAARAAAAEHDVRRQAERVEAVLEQACRDRPA